MLKSNFTKTIDFSNVIKFNVDYQLSVFNDIKYKKQVVEAICVLLQCIIVLMVIVSVGKWQNKTSRQTAWWFSKHSTWLGGEAA